LFSLFADLKEESKADELGICKATKREVLLIDGMNTFCRAFAAVPTLNDDGLHTGGISGFLKSIGYAIKLLNPDRCVVIFDGPGGSLKRRKIYPDYKAHRKTKLRLNRMYDDDSLNLGDEEESIKKQLQRTVMYMKLLPVNMLSLDNVEADDTIAHCALDYFKDWKTYIMSTDKDFLQIVSDNVNVWSPIKKRLYGPAEVIGEYGVDTKNFTLYRALDGDTSDNIPGIKGCGLKTILKVFPFLKETSKVELKQLYDHAFANRGKFKVYDAVVENWSDVERNYELMQLVDTQLQTFAQLHIKEILDNPIPKLQRLAFYQMLAEDKLLNTIPNNRIWVNECFQRLDGFIRD
jgi:5'-3' exonuclease